MNNDDNIAAYYTALVESSDDAIISKDLGGIITSWNKAAERLLGYTAEEAIGQHISFIIPHDRIYEEEQIIANLRQGRRIEHFETMRRAKNGGLINISITVSPIRNRKGEIIGASKIARDISDRIRAERALAELALKKDEFLANISHELRTPLNAVVGIANILSVTEPLTDKQKKYLNTLKLSADSLLALINDLLDFAKLEDGSVEFENIEFDFSEIVRNVLPLMEVRAREKKLDLSIDLSPAFSAYVGDPLRVQQILTNLISNAIKFTDKGYVKTTIDSMPGPDDDTSLVTIKVKDTGIGIPEEKLEMIFDKFGQADASISRRYGGTGLGLSITRSIVERIGGTITVQSEPGKGSEFSATIPLKKADAVARQKAADAKNILPDKQKAILLVEDYEPNILVTSTLLKQFGYNFDIARNGKEAIDKYASCRYDLILMDIQMPEMDGLEATRRIRIFEEEKGLPAIPIIAMTAHVMERDKSKCLDAGMNDFLPKPFNPAELSTKLAKQMDIRSTEE